LLLLGEEGILWGLLAEELRDAWFVECLGDEFVPPTEAGGKPECRVQATKKMQASSAAAAAKNSVFTIGSQKTSHDLWEQCSGFGVESQIAVAWIGKRG